MPSWRNTAAKKEALFALFPTNKQLNTVELNTFSVGSFCKTSLIAVIAMMSGLKNPPPEFDTKRK